MKQASVGFSKNINAHQAGQEAIKQALESINSKEVKLALVFATAGYDQATLLKSIKSSLNNVAIVGCSGEGIITKLGSDESSYAVSVMLIASKDAKIKTFQIKNFSKNSKECGINLAQQIASADFEGKMLLLFIDGTTSNSSEFLQSLQKSLPYQMIIAGGAAGAIMDKIDKTYQYFDGEVFNDSICAVMLGGNIETDVVVSHGCQPVGIELTVTKANGPYVEEINGKYAWDVFREYLDNEPEELYTEDLVHLCIGEQLPKHIENEDQNIL